MNDSLENSTLVKKLRRNSTLNEQQEAFCIALIENGGNGALAARTAGYSAKSARRIASELKTRPDIARRIAEYQREFIQHDLSNKALHVVSELLTNPKTPPVVRLGAARTALAAAGLDKPTETKLLENKDLSDMDLSELQEFIKAGSRRLANLRSPIADDIEDAEIIG